MELIQAIVFTTRYIFKTGNLDLYYFFAIAIAIYMFAHGIWKKYWKRFLFLTSLLLCMSIGSLLFAGMQHDIIKMVVFICKMMLCFVLMFAVIEYFEKINVKKILFMIVGIHAIETIIALFYRSELLWRLNDTVNGFSETRLELLYIEPSELSMCVAVLIILIGYLIEKDGFDKWYLPCLIVLGIDLILSAGIGGILGLFGAIGLTLCYKAVEIAIVDKKWYGIAFVVILALIAVGIIYGTDFPIAQRVRLILGGEHGADQSMFWRLTVPLEAIGPLILSTNYMGVGLGNFNTKYGIAQMMQCIGQPNRFPNSFLYFIAEGVSLQLHWC